jgi:hypothetical protein
VARVLLLVLLVLAVGAGAYAVGAARGDDGPSLVRVVAVGSTDSDATHDKWVTAECPKGMTAVGGGAHVPHANDTPGVALYWTAPYEDHGTNGWWAAAQDTARGKRPWLLQVEAVCMEGVTTRADPAGSLPPEVFPPAAG